MTTEDGVTERRAILKAMILALCAGFIADRPAKAEEASPGPVAPIRRLDAALLAAMKAGPGTPFVQRFAALRPVIERTFDLDTILAITVGMRWTTLPSYQKQRLAAAFRRYTVATYTANFDHYDGQRFQLQPATRPVGNGDVIVYSKFIGSDGSAVALDYVMRDGARGWQAVDVLAEGGISRVATQRSEFNAVLSSGGAPALTAALEQKVASLSGGAIA